MATSDSLFDFVPAISGVSLIRFPTAWFQAFTFFQQIKQGLSGYLDELSLRATALYTVPANRSSYRSLPFRGRLRL